MEFKAHGDFFTFIESFCERDGMRISLSKPTCYEDGLVIASDSQQLILFYDQGFNEKYPDLTFKYKEGGDFNGGVNAIPVISTFLEKYVNNPESSPIGIISLEDFDSVFQRIRMIPEYKHEYADCEQCDGIGEVTCDCCGHDHECEECDGEGSITIPSTEVGYYKFPSDECFKIGEVCFSLRVINRLCESLKIMDIHSLDVYQIEHSSKKAFFGIKGTGCYILVMGIYHEDSDFKMHVIHVNKD